MPVPHSEFLGLEKPHIDIDYEYYQLIGLKHYIFNLYQRISSISLGKEKVESNFINN